MADPAADQSSAEHDILHRIHDLIEAEHGLRAGDHDQNRLREVEAALDQCWDLLRQWRARQEFHTGAGAAARPVSEVENYLQ